MEQYPDGTYTIYSEHIGSRVEAVRMADTLQHVYPTVEFLVVHGVEGIGSGYRGDNEDLGIAIDDVVSHYCD